MIEIVIFCGIVGAIIAGIILSLFFEVMIRREKRKERQGGDPT